MLWCLQKEVENKRNMQCQRLQLLVDRGQIFARVELLRQTLRKPHWRPRYPAVTETVVSHPLEYWSLPLNKQKAASTTGIQKNRPAWKLCPPQEIHLSTPDLHFHVPQCDASGQKLAMA